MSLSISISFCFGIWWVLKYSREKVLLFPKREIINLLFPNYQSGIAFSDLVYMECKSLIFPHLRFHPGFFFLLMTMISALLFYVEKVLFRTWLIMEFFVNINFFHGIDYLELNGSMMRSFPQVFYLKAYLEYK
jgi:hypothetical protein